MVIRFASQYGGDAWCVKPEFISEVLCTYAQIADIKDTELHEALLNMSIARASDPDNNDKRVPRCILYKPPGDPQKAYRIESHRCCTMISIPFSTLANQKERRFVVRPRTTFDSDTVTDDERKVTPWEPFESLQRDRCNDRPKRTNDRSFPYATVTEPPDRVMVSTQ